jgi:hypothetical protein
LVGAHGVAGSHGTVGTHGASPTQPAVVHDPSERNAISAPEVTFPASRNDERLLRLEEAVDALRAELDDLKARLGG